MLEIFCIKKTISYINTPKKIHSISNHTYFVSLLDKTKLSLRV